MKIRNLFLPSVALGAAVLLATPEESSAFNLLGHSLSPTQADFRVFNNFLDATANNNTTITDDFPGYSGAVLAFWKGATEWSSGPHGDGGGDPFQGILGSGGSSFDPIFNGEANSTGSIGNNIASSLNQNQGGTLAFMQGGSSGWWIRFLENWTWDDGPNTNIGSRVDLQGVACHEYGHSLGLNHTFVGGAPTMFPSISGGGIPQRSIANDDRLGIQAIYGVANNSGTKPVITQVINLGSQVRILGTNFKTSNNEVWFTRLNIGSSGGSGGNPIKVTGVASIGGTEIIVNIPASAGPGDIQVLRNAFSQEASSACFPFDPFSVVPPAPMITTVSPSQVPTLESTGGATVTLTGTGFTGATNLFINDKMVADPSQSFTGDWTVDSDTQITIEMPLTASIGVVDIEFSTAGGPATAQIEIVGPSSPVLAVEDTNLDQSVGLSIAHSSNDLDISTLQFSVVDGITSFPGFFELEIGNGNLANIFKGKTWNLGPKLWRKLDTGPLSNLPIGVTIYFEALVAESSAGYAFPWDSSNKVAVTVTN